MKKKSIPGWTINVEEISNGVFKVTLKDAYGRIAEIIDYEIDKTIVRALGEAFDIEKQISKNWNLFLYDLANQKLSVIEVEQKEYNDKAFGSWFIKRQDKRMVYDGKDSWLIFQAKTEDGWTDIEVIEKCELNYSSFARQINRLTENATNDSTLEK